MYQLKLSLGVLSNRSLTSAVLVMSALFTFGAACGDGEPISVAITNSNEQTTIDVAICNSDRTQESSDSSATWEPCSSPVAIFESVGPGQTSAFKELISGKYLVYTRIQLEADDRSTRLDEDFEISGGSKVVLEVEGLDLPKLVVQQE